MAIKHHSNENFLDNNKLTFGTSDDLQLYHSGSHSYVDGNNTGDLYIRSLNDDVVVQAADDVFIYTQGGEDAIIARGDGGVELYHNNVKKFETTSAGATFAGDIHLGANYIGRDTHNIIDFATDNHITFKTDQSTALQIDSNQSVKVVAGSLQISGDNANYVTLTESGSGDFTIDAADDIRLDAGGGDVVLKDDGTEFGRLTNSSTDFVISASTQDKDILFKGDDGGSAITALTLDMSDGGWATFNSGIAVANTFSPSTFGKATFAGVVDFNGSETRFNPNANSSAKIYSVGTNATALYAGAGDGLYLGANDAAGMYFASGVDATFLGNVTLADAKNLNLGADSDLQLYHDATHSHIVNLTGNLRIRNFADDSDVTLESDDGSGGTTAYLTLDGSAGLTLSNVNMKWNDGVSAVFGTGGDSLVRHTGTNMEITNSAGVVLVTGTPVNFGVDDTGIDVKFFGATSGRYMLWDESGDYLKFTDGAQAVFGTGGDLGIQHDGGNSYIVHGGTGNLIIRQNTNDADIKFDCDDGAGGTATYLTLDGSDTSVLFSKTLKVVDSAYIGLGDSFDFHLQHNGTDSKITNSTGDLYITNGADDKRIRFQADDGAGGVTTYFDMQGSAATHDGSATTSLFTQWYDNSRISFGNGHDTQIYHDGTNTNFYHQTGNLIFKQAEADGDMIFQADDGSGGLATYLTLDGSATTVNVTKKLIVDTGSDNLIAEFKSSGDSIGEIRIADNSKYTRLLTVGDTFKIMPSDGDEVFNVSDSAISVLAPLTVGVDDTGHDVKFFGATSGRYMEWDESADALKFADSAFLYLGAGNDLQFYHNGTNSVIANYGGDFYITQNTNDKDIIFECDDGSGGAEEYFRLDGSASAGNPITSFPDNSILSFGTGGDMRLTHNATDSTIFNYTGSLRLRQEANDGDILFQSDDGSGGVATYFYLDGSSASDGTLYTQFPDNSNLTFGSADDLQIKHDGTDSKITNSTGDLVIRNLADNKDVIFQSDDGSGGVETYFFLNGGLSSPYTIFPDGTHIGLGNSIDLAIYHDSANSYLSQNGTGNLIIQHAVADSDIIFRADDGSGGTTAYLTLDGSAETINAAKSMVFADNAAAYFGAGLDLEINSNGSSSSITGRVGDLTIGCSTDDGDIIFSSDDGSGGTTEYIRIDGGQTRTEFAKPTQHADNAIANFGSSSDMQIYHNGTDSYILNGTGDLEIINNTDDGDIIFKSDDGSGGTTEYFRLDGGDVKIDFTQNVRHGDNVMTNWGSSNDLQIYHDGTDSYVSNTQNSGDLIIENGGNNKDVIFRCDDNSGGLTAYLTLDGSATNVNIHKQAVFSDELVIPEYIVHTGDGNTGFGFAADDTFRVITGGTTRLNITTGIELTGNATFTGDVNLADSKKLQLGASQDLQIFHDGTNTFIESYTGNFDISQLLDDGTMRFRADDGSGGTTTYLDLNGNDGTINAHVEIRWPDGIKAKFGSSQDLQIYHDGSNSYIDDGGTGELRIRASATAITSANGNEYIAYFAGTGGQSASLYAGGSKKLETTSTGISVTGDVTVSDDIFVADSGIINLGSGNDLKILHDSNHSYIKNYTGDLYIENFADDKDIIFKSDDGSGGVTAYLTLDGSIAKTTVSRPLKFNDNISAEYGTDTDMIMYSSGSHGYIENYTGDLKFINNTNDKDIIFQSDDQSGGAATYFYLDGSVGFNRFPYPVIVEDSVNFNLGTGQDMQLLHNGSDSVIRNSTGDLYITNYADDKDIIFQSDNGSGGDATYFRLDGSEVETRFHKATLHYDNVKAKYGDSGDLQIYHDGSHSFIADSGTGHLQILSSQLQINNAGNTENMITAAENGSVTLFNDGSAKLATTSTGVAVTGDVTVSDDIFVADSGIINLGTGNDLQIYHSGSNSHITDAGTGNLFIEGSNHIYFRSADQGEYYAQFNDDGACKFYHNNVVKLETTSAGITVAGNIVLSDDGTIGSASDTDAISIDDSGVVTFSSRIIANVREFEVASGTDGDGKGDVVYFGSTTSMTAGKIYHYKSDGTWELADASAVATCDGLLAVALGTASNTHGMLLRGMVTIANDPGAVGDVLYVSETGGQAIATAPSTSNAIVRVIGYCVHATNGNIWFNPDGTFVEVA
jgi:hypothetical protein